MHYVTYLRVSTQRQGASGLGLEAQRAMVDGFIMGGVTQSEYVEVESGKNNDRPKLAAAIEEAKRTGARLVIAKLDPLARNVAFIAALMETKVDFVAVDLPSATPFTLHVFAALAEQEALMISQRTKAALAAKKARGEKLGTPANLTNEARARGTAATKTAAANDKANIQARDMVELLTKEGLTLTAIAKRLNEKTFRTRRGCLFTLTAIKRLQVPKMV